MSETEAPLTSMERVLIVSLYARLTSLDVLHPRQRPDSEKNQQVARSHISVSHPLSHNQSHQEAS